MQIHPRLAQGLAILCLWSTAHIAHAAGVVTATSASGTISVNTDISSSKGTTVATNGCNGCAPTVNVWSTDAVESGGELTLTMVQPTSTTTPMFEAYQDTYNNGRYTMTLSQYAYVDIPVALTLAAPVNTSLQVTVSLQLLSNSGSTAQPFTLYVRGQDTSGGTTLATLTGMDDGSTGTWSFQGLLPASGLSSLTVGFSVSSGELASVGLNHISMQLVSSVPEPASCLTMGLGLAAIGMASRRGRRGIHTRATLN
jgi:hypothetical protein